MGVSATDRNVRDEAREAAKRPSPPTDLLQGPLRTGAVENNVLSIMIRGDLTGVKGR